MYDPIMEYINEAIIFFEKVFGKELLRKEVKKLESYTSKYHGNMQEKFDYIMTKDVHRAAIWWVLLNRIKETGSIDIRNNEDIINYMDALLFHLALSTLLKDGIKDLNDKRFKYRLVDKDAFERLYYEILVTYGYYSNGYKVSFPEEEKGRGPDLYVEKNGDCAYVECKRVGREIPWGTLAALVLERLSEKDFNIALIVDIKSPPVRLEEYPILADRIINMIEQKQFKEKGIKIQIERLPKEAILSNKNPIKLVENFDINFRSFDFVAHSFLHGIIGGVPKIRNPKIVAFRDTGKLKRIRKAIRKNLEKAHHQLSEYKNFNRIVCVDVTLIVKHESRKIISNTENLENELLRKIKEYIEHWIKHKDLSAVIITYRKIYLDPLNIPTFLVFDHIPIVNTDKNLPLFKGFTVEMHIKLPPEGELIRLHQHAIESARIGNLDEALIILKKIIELDPKFKEAYENIARILIQMGRPKEALTYLDKVLQLYPNYVTSWVSKGVAYAYMKKYKKAIKCFKKVLKLDPHNPSAIINLAKIYYITHNRSEARKWIKKALELNPNDPQLVEIYNKLFSNKR